MHDAHMGTCMNEHRHEPPLLHSSQVGFLFLRYVGEPKQLWGWIQPYIKDNEVRNSYMTALWLCFTCLWQEQCSCLPFTLPMHCQLRCAGCKNALCAGTYSKPRRQGHPIGGLCA